jgi:hypothetical protein
MTEHRSISHSDLWDEMAAVARGEKPAPAWAGTHTFESVGATRDRSYVSREGRADSATSTVAKG